MYRSDDEAKLRRELKEYQEKVAELDGVVVPEYKRQISILNAKLNRLKSERARNSWLRDFAPKLGAGILICFLAIGFYFLCVVIIENSKSDPYAGTIVEKNHTPAHTTYNTICTSSKNGTTCSHIPVHHPDTWSVRLRFDEETRSYSISRQIYDAIETGHWLCLPQAEIADCTRDSETIIYR